MAACAAPAPSGSPGTTVGSPSASDSAATSTASSTAPSTSATAALPGLPSGTVLAVKIDNTAASRPRIGIDKAAVVYVEPVEGGLTRLLAVFSTGVGDLPGEVGPIRSARESDVTMLANWGRVAFAYSGGSAYTRGVVDRAELASVPYDASTRGYRRAGDRRAPYNVIGDSQALLTRAAVGPAAGDPGFRFGPAGPGGTPGTSVTTAWPAARVAFTWDGATGRYLLATDGRPDLVAGGAQLGAATVVVQEVTTHLSENRDVNGAQTPVVDLVGSGPVTVLRDGLAWRGQWSRAATGSATNFQIDGQPIPMAFGPVWVLLVPAGQQVTVG